ncbi:caspase-8 isoform X2 [Misgurnus anguillicaudatus]|uniref:caspase-8 isoform X2 n=1 Tax=Misgurnus anguillicaudatus TaxID=75329 RepID=UPI003CCF79E5
MQTEQKEYRERILQNKLFLIATLQEDVTFVLQFVQENKLITDRDYNQLNDARRNEGGESTVITLLDKLRGKGEETCKKFTEVLGQIDILETFPKLKNHPVLGTDNLFKDNSKELLDDELLLPELLYRIGRLDMLVILGISKEQVERHLQACRDLTKGVSAYRCMLYGLSVSIKEENLHQMRFQWSKRSKTQLGPFASFLDILIDMEKQQRLKEDNLDELHDILNICDKELAWKIEEFKNRHRDQQQGEVTKQELELPEEEYYTMTQRPVGYCLIMNNFNFHSTSMLANRTGTDKDRDDLSRVFRKMHFLVEVRNDLQAADMLNVINEFAQKDHSRMDAFVCCILSHGAESTVLSTDGKEILIRDLTLPYAESRTLANKPKLFFIQACQGSKAQQGVLIETGQENITADGGYEKDAQMVVQQSIPLEADFLIAMATVGHCQSFRNTRDGSIYIQELCRQLEKLCPRKVDILSILISVNREVSKKNMRGYKQIPEPRYTLTKKLVLPWTDAPDCPL